MTQFLIAFSVAALLTAIFAFRFGQMTRQGVLGAYFALFLTIEWVAAKYFIPEGALGIEVAYLCLGLTMAFVVAGILRHRYEKSQQDPVPGEDRAAK